MPELARRSALIIAFILIYFLVVRPLRGVVNEMLFHPVVETVVQSQPELSFSGNSRAVDNHVLVEEGNRLNELYVTVPFGLHFLLACVGLAAIKSGRRYYGILVAIQVATGVLSLVFFWLSGVLGIQLISLTDLTVRYLNPLLSLGLVPLAFTLKKQPINES